MIPFSFVELLLSQEYDTLPRYILGHTNPLGPGSNNPFRPVATEVEQVGAKPLQTSASKICRATRYRAPGLYIGQLLGQHTSANSRRRRVSWGRMPASLLATKLVRDIILTLIYKPNYSPLVNRFTRKSYDRSKSQLED